MAFWAGNWRKDRRLASVLFALAMAAAPGVRADEGSKDNAPLTLKQRQDMRFPQAVRVGRLPGEAVVEHGAALRRLGVVVGVFKTSDDELELVFRYGGFLGIGGRIIAPPIEEVSLVGPMVKINELDHADLAALPTFNGSNGAFLRPDEVIRMGIDRKY